MANGPVSVEGDLDDALNRVAFSSNDLDASSVETQVGHDSATIARIKSKLATLDLELAIPDAGQRDQFALMAVLRKALPFRYEFDQLSLTFENGSQSSSVKAFGIKDKLSTGAVSGLRQASAGQGLSIGRRLRYSTLYDF